MHIYQILGGQNRYVSTDNHSIAFLFLSPVDLGDKAKRIHLNLKLVARRAIKDTWPIRDWSLSMDRGGLQNGRGGMQRFTPTKRGAEKVLAMLKEGGGHNKF